MKIYVLAGLLAFLVQRLPDLLDQWQRWGCGSNFHWKGLQLREQLPTSLITQDHGIPF